MASIDKIPILTRRRDFWDAFRDYFALDTRVLREFSKTSLFSDPNKACDRTAREFAKREGYNLIYRTGVRHRGPFTTTATYEFYRLEE